MGGRSHRRASGRSDGTKYASIVRRNVSVPDSGPASATDVMNGTTSSTSCLCLRPSRVSQSSRFGSAAGGAIGLQRLSYHAMRLSGMG